MLQRKTLEKLIERQQAEDLNNAAIEVNDPSKRHGMDGAINLQFNVLVTVFTDYANIEQFYFGHHII